MTGRLVTLAVLTVVACGLVQWLAAPAAALFFWPAAAAVAMAPFAWRRRRSTWLVAALGALGFAFCELSSAAQPAGLTLGQGTEATHLAAAVRQPAGWATAAVGAALLLAVARVAAYLSGRGLS